MHNGELNRDGLDVAKFLEDSFENYGTDEQPSLPRFEIKTSKKEYGYETYPSMMLRREYSFIDREHEMYNVHKGK